MAPKSSIGSLSKMAQSLRAKTAANSAKSRPNGQAGFKSQEHIEDSDTSSDGSTSDSNSGSDSEEELAAAKRKLNKEIAAQKKAAAIGSKGMVNGTKPEKSTTAMTVQAKSQRAPTPKKTATKKNGAGTSDSETGDSNSDSEEESDSSTKLRSQAKSAQTKANKSTKNTRNASETSSDGSNSESEDSKNTNPLAVARLSGASETSKAHTSSQNAEVTRPAWLNNSDFMLRKAASDNPGKEVSDFLSKSNLEGKQVWYFTAPASLPITVLKDMEIDLAKAESGGALLTHNGDAYGLDLEPYSTSTQIQLLIPSKGGEKYTNLNRAIDSTIHLRRIAEFGGGSKVSSTATDEYTRLAKPVREQPKNLKPRFTPIGIPTPTPTAVSITKTKSTSTVSTKSKVAKKSKSKSSSDTSSGSSDEEMTDAPTLPINGGLKRKQPLVEDSSSDASDSSDSSDSSESDSEPVPTAAKTSKTPDKSVKRPKITGSGAHNKTPTLQANSVTTSGSQFTKVPKSSDAKKATPVPTPSLHVPSSSFPLPSSTPSKLPDSKSKKAKKVDDKNSVEKEPKKIRQTPIPPPKVGLNG